MGHLGIPHSPSYPATDSSVPPVPCSQRDIPHIHTVAGQAYDEVLCLKDANRERKRLRNDAVMNGGEVVDTDVVADGGADGGEGVAVVDGVDGGAVQDSDAELLSYFLSSSFPDQIEVESLGNLDMGILYRCLTSDYMEPEDSESDTVALRAAYVSSHIPSFSPKLPLPTLKLLLDQMLIFGMLRCLGR